MTKPPKRNDVMGTFSFFEGDSGLILIIFSVCFDLPSITDIRQCTVSLYFTCPAAEYVTIQAPKIVTDQMHIPQI
jgi:hypothetical protein